MTGLSSHCEQGIHHNCNSNPLTGVSSWTDINNKKNHYWDGNHASSHTGCSCALNNSCDPGFIRNNANFKCFCDSYSMNVVDDGLLTSAAKLPVIKLHYGGSLNRMSRIIYRLDPLVCSGKSTHYPSEDVEVKFKTLTKKNNQLEQKLVDIEEKLTSLSNETNEAMLEKETSIQDLSSKTENSLTLLKSEQQKYIDQTTFKKLETKVKGFDKRVAFRWSGMNARNGDPSKRDFVQSSFSFLIQ